MFIIFTYYLHLKCSTLIRIDYRQFGLYTRVKGHLLCITVPVLYCISVVLKLFICVECIALRPPQVKIYNLKLRNVIQCWNINTWCWWSYFSDVCLHQIYNTFQWFKSRIHFFLLLYRSWHRSECWAYLYPFWKYMHLLGKEDASSSTLNNVLFTSPVRIHHHFRRSRFLASDPPLSASHAGLIRLSDETVIHYVITQGNSDPIMSAAGRNGGDGRKNSGSVSSCRDWQRILAETDGSIFLHFVGSWLWL